MSDKTPKYFDSTAYEKRKIGLSYFTYMCILWDKTFQSFHNFDLVTLTLKFDLLLKKFNLGNNLWTVRDS